MQRLTKVKDSVDDLRHVFRVFVSLNFYYFKYIYIILKSYILSKIKLSNFKAILVFLLFD